MAHAKTAERIFIARTWALVSQGRACASTPTTPNHVKSASTTSNALSTIAKPSRSSASVMQSGGMHVKFECFTNVNKPFSRKNFDSFAIVGDDDAYAASGS